MGVEGATMQGILAVDCEGITGGVTRINDLEELEIELAGDMKISIKTDMVNLNVVVNNIYVSTLEEGEQLLAHILSM